MVSSQNTGFKVLTEEDLNQRATIQRRFRTRLALAVIAAILGVALCYLAMMPNLAKQYAPLDWVYQANAHGLTDALKENGIRLLANGRIQVIPEWFSWVTGSLGAICIWLSSILFNNRNNERWFGNTFSLSYWKTFYALKEPEAAHLVVKAQKKSLVVKASKPRPKSQPVAPAKPENA